MDSEDELLREQALFDEDLPPGADATQEHPDIATEGDTVDEAGNRMAVSGQKLPPRDLPADEDGHKKAQGEAMEEPVQRTRRRAKPVATIAKAVPSRQAGVKKYLATPVPP